MNILKKIFSKIKVSDSQNESSDENKIPLKSYSRKVIDENNEYLGKTFKSLYVGEDIPEDIGLCNMIEYLDIEGKQMKLEAFYSHKFSQKEGYYKSVVYFGENQLEDKMETYKTKSNSIEKGYIREIIYFQKYGSRRIRVLFPEKYYRINNEIIKVFELFGENGKQEKAIIFHTEEFAVNNGFDVLINWYNEDGTSSTSHYCTEDFWDRNNYSKENVFFSEVISYLDDDYFFPIVFEKDYDNIKITELPEKVHILSSDREPTNSTEINKDESSSDMISIIERENENGGMIKEIHFKKLAQDGVVKKIEYIDINGKCLKIKYCYSKQKIESDGVDWKTEYYNKNNIKIKVDFHNSYEFEIIEGFEIKTEHFNELGDCIETEKKGFTHIFENENQLQVYRVCYYDENKRLNKERVEFDENYTEQTGICSKTVFYDDAGNIVKTVESTDRK